MACSVEVLMVWWVEAHEVLVGKSGGCEEAEVKRGRMR